MFLAPGQSETGVLRQGDIIGPIHTVGALNLREIQYPTTYEGTKARAWTVPSDAEFHNAMILSHSCEIDPKNTTKLTSIILAPLREAHRATEPAKLELLRSSNIIREGVDASFLKYFYLDPHPRLARDDGEQPNAAGYCVDFSKCFSVRKTCYQFLLDRKKLQLTPEIAEAAAFKLALFFYRAQEARAALASAKTGGAGEAAEPAAESPANRAGSI